LKIASSSRQATDRKSKMILIKQWWKSKIKLAPSRRKLKNSRNKMKASGHRRKK
jgi:hypothetical protein